MQKSRGRKVAELGIDERAVEVENQSAAKGINFSAGLPAAGQIGALSFDSALQFLLFLLAKVFEEIFQGGTFLDDGIQLGNCRSQLAFFDSAVS